MYLLYCHSSYFYFNNSSIETPNPLAIFAILRYPLKNIYSAVEYMVL